MSSLSSSLIAVGLAVSMIAGPSVFSPAGAQTRPAAHYELSKEELAYDCKKLTGRLKIRILQVRHFAERRPTSETARNAQSLVTPILGGPQYGADPIADQTRDRAMLEAYNRRLAQKNCKTVDLEAELRPQPPRP